MRRIGFVTAAAGAACALGMSTAFAAGLADPIPAPLEPSRVQVAFATVADGLESPVAGTTAPGDGEHLFVSDQNGMLWGVDVGDRGDDDPGDDDTDGDDSAQDQSGKWLVGDFSRLLVHNLAAVIPGLPYDERGLLSVAFDPRFEHNGLLYTFTSEDPTAPADFTTQPGETPAGGQAVVTEWSVMDPEADHITVDMSSRRVLMRIDKPQFNHNGGQLAFGRDGMLYVSIGDGGAADDEGAGHVPGGNAQSLAPGNVLGKVLRIDPHGHNSANGQYGVPATNPFVGMPGADEIWAYGFRNPYRFSFDHRRLIVADVGQNDIEEVDVVRPGGNYGWPVKEGTFLFDNGGPTGAGSVTADSPGSPAGLIDPVAEYDHTAPGGVRCGTPGSGPSACQGIAVVGGFVYHGDVDGLHNRYVFGDYSRAFARPLGRLFVLDGSQVRTLADPGVAVFGFGQDARREMYVLGNHTGVLSGATGVVLRITGVDD